MPNMVPRFPKCPTFPSHHVFEGFLLSKTQIWKIEKWGPIPYYICRSSSFSLQRVDGGAEVEDGLLHVVLDVRNIMGDHLK